MRYLATVAMVLMMAACGGGSNNGDDTTPDGPPGNPPDADPDGYSMLISRSWTVPAGQYDVYKCVRIQIDHDIFVGGFRPDAPQGSHHSVLTYATSNPGQLGEYDCNVNTLDFQHMLFASGVGTNDLEFPVDVGVKIPAGAYVNLNLHLFNAGESEISGTSGVLVKELPGEPPTLAEMTFAGDMTLNIPAQSVGHEESGGCDVTSQSYTVLALWPHMHQLAVHQKVQFTHNGVTTDVHDMPYSFSNQQNWPQNPTLALVPGDHVNVVCTYDNNTNATVQFGDSSTAEMCFTGLYVYPRASSLFGCVTGVGSSL